MKMPLCPAVLLCSKKPRKLTLLLAHFHSSLGPESPGPYGLLQALNFLRRERGGRGSPTHWRNCLRPLCWGLLCSVIQKIQTALFQNSEFLFPLLPPQIDPRESTSSRTPSFSEEDQNDSILYRGHGNYIEQTTLSSRWVQPRPLTKLNLNLSHLSGLDLCKLELQDYGEN